ncbi:MAG: DUF308 domain-containing protein [Tyzzerella sp.]|nr:DUF308 domain-containing protein [Tyzzerella sp.]
MNNRSRKTLHLVAGIYLLYLAFQLLSEVGENGNPAVSIIGGIAFVIAGGYLIFNFIRALKNEFEETYEESNEAIDKESVVEDEELTEVTVEMKEEDTTCE